MLMKIEFKFLEILVLLIIDYLRISKGLKAYDMDYSIIRFLRRIF